MLKYSSTTRRDSRRTSSTKRLYRRLLLGALGVLVLGLALPHLYATIGAALLWPVDQTTRWVTESSASLPQFLRNRNQLLDEIQQLERDVASTAGIRLSLSHLEQENAELRALLGDAESERLLARVINRPPHLLYDRLQIDRGAVDGVTVGAPVFTGVNTVVGVVVHVGPAYSFVELVTTPGFESTAYVLGPDVFATLEGVGGGIARLRLPQGVPIKPEQLVILPTIESGLYGEVVSVENVPTQPEQYGYVAPAVPLRGVQYVTVGTAPPVERSLPEIEAAVREAARTYFSVSSTTRAALDNFVSTSTATTATSTLVR